MTETREHARSRLRLSQFLCAIACAVSIYLLYGSLTGERLAGCGFESGCEKVLGSRWAYFFSVPVSAFAVLIYPGIILVTWRLGAQSLVRPASRFLLSLAASALIAAAVYFAALQVFVIGALCVFCMTAHTCGTLAGLLLLVEIRRASFQVQLVKPEPPSSSKPAGRSAENRGHNPVETGGSTSPQSSLAPVLAGFGLVALLAAGQVIHQPKAFTVDSSSSLSARKASRLIQLHEGAFQLDLHQTPVIGSPEAPMVIVHLFDYTCPHCRRLHPILKAAHEMFTNRLAITSLLVPLATNCNPLVKRPIEEHRTACELATAGLAVWRVDRSRLPAFEEWIFAGPKAPPPEAVMAKGRELVGTNAFDYALKDPWISDHLSRNISLYHTNHVRFRKSVLPELMIGTNITSGALRSLDDLLGLLRQLPEFDRTHAP